MMTKQDYMVLATLSSTRTSEPRKGGNIHSYKAGVVATAREIADHLEVNSARFDRTRFYRACGIEDDLAAARVRRGTRNLRFVHG